MIAKNAAKAPTGGALIERLEVRTLFSGDVTAELRGSTLLIRGGDGDEIVRIDRKGVPPGGIRVSGDGGTTINGRRWSSAFSAGVREVKVRLGGGDDRLTITRSTIKGDLRIDMGAGEDFVRLAQSTIWGDVGLTGGDGTTQLQFRGSTVGGRTWIGTASDDDSVNLGASSFHRALEIRTGAGNDYIAFGQASPTGEPLVDSGTGDDIIIRDGTTRSWDFRDGQQGWDAGFADLPADTQGEDFQLESGLRPLPAELNMPGTGFLLSGENLSDDLFMFLKRRLGPEDGIVPGQAYQATFNILFGSNHPQAGGLGAPPYLKAGLAPVEPTTVVDDNGYLRMNVDKGNQANSGPAATVIGDINNGLSADESSDGGYPFVSVARRGVHQQTVTAGSNGELWLLVGTDSGFESLTTIFYQRIEVNLAPIAP